MGGLEEGRGEEKKAGLNELLLDWLIQWMGWKESSVYLSHIQTTHPPTHPPTHSLSLQEAISVCRGTLSQVSKPSSHPPTHPPTLLPSSKQ